MLELLICVAMDIMQSEPVTRIANDTVSAIRNRDEACVRNNATCGYIENDAGDKVNCGDCLATFEYCGGAAPNSDGSIGNGTPLTCGGGCTEVDTFYCPWGGAAIQCSLPGSSPRNKCQPYGNESEGKWCCEK